MRPTWTWTGSVPETTTFSLSLSSFKFHLRWLVAKNGNYYVQSIVEMWTVNVNGVGDLTQLALLRWSRNSTRSTIKKTTTRAFTLVRKLNTVAKKRQQLPLLYSLIRSGDLALYSFKVLNDHWKEGQKLVNWKVSIFCAMISKPRQEQLPEETVSYLWVPTYIHEVFIV